VSRRWHPSVLLLMSNSTKCKLVYSINSAHNNASNAKSDEDTTIYRYDNSSDGNILRKIWTVQVHGECVDRECIKYVNTIIH